jgi:dTDP-4-dehydrorhamnose 3,5-epimerase
MKVEELALPGVVLITLKAFRDDRGSFAELFNGPRYASLGLPSAFVQDNLSQSRRGTLRGLHFQNPQPQGKLVQVLRGRVYDVAVDIRRGSPHFGRWIGIELSEETPQQLWIPPGFAHGFLALTDADFLYKCTEVYAPKCDRAILWNDPDLDIRWPEVGPPLLSPKDAAAPRLSDATELPAYEPPV